MNLLSGRRCDDCFNWDILVMELDFNGDVLSVGLDFDAEVLFLDWDFTTWF